jgi:hypothetical protein
MSKRALLAAICLLLAFNSLDTVLAQGPGAIEGQVVNETAGAARGSVAGLQVVLYMSGAEGEELAGRATTDEEGRFRFEDLDTNATLGYRFRIEYEGVTYEGEATFSPGKTVLPIVATIYETTTSDEAIVVDRHHVIVDFSADTMLVQELYVLDNTADTIYVGDEGGVLRFSLPGDATDLRLDDLRLELNSVETDEGFASLLPVTPGQIQVLYSYVVPYDGTARVLSPQVPYPTANLDVMIADVGVQGESAQLAQDLGPDAETEIQLSGAPQGKPQLPVPGASPGLGVQNLGPWIALGLAVLGAVLAFVQLYLRRGGQREQGTGPSETQAVGRSDSGLKTQRQELLQLVADLDDAFAEGRVTEEGYHELRRSVRSRLTEVSQQLARDGQD